MKKILIYLSAIMLTAGLWSCSDDDLNSRSVFVDPVGEQSAFDKWLYREYVMPYNIEVKYRLEDIESNMDYQLSPTKKENAMAMSRVIKYMWLDAYDEVAGFTFTRTNIPRVIHFIGSGAYNTNNTYLLGVAEGGMKVTLYKLNDVDFGTATGEDLNERYLKTMHHEFAHILHQTKNYSESFQQISMANYIQDEWSSISQTDAIALKLGFMTRYSRKNANEDFVEIISAYITYSDELWNSRISQMGTDGYKAFMAKFEIVESYLKNSWQIDIHELRKVIQRRTADIDDMDLLATLE